MRKFAKFQSIWNPFKIKVDSFKKQNIIFYDFHTPVYTQYLSIFFDQRYQKTCSNSLFNLDFENILLCLSVE